MIGPSLGEIRQRISRRLRRRDRQSDCQDKTDVDDAEGVLWTTRDSCRTCGSWIENVDEAPTAPDRSDPLTTVGSWEPRATFCSDRCRRDFLEIHQGRRVASDD